MMPNYTTTKLACYIGYITQAITINFPPLLFLTFRKIWGITDSQLAFLIALVFVVQLAIDYLSAFFLDKLDHKTCLVISHVVAAAGLAGLAFVPDLLPSFAGLLLCAIVYSLGSGLNEVLISPTVERCPRENDSDNLGFLHSFYSWGCVLVILLSTLYFVTIGIEHWRFLSIFWALIPACNIFLFLRAPMPPLEPEEKRMNVKSLSKSPFFWLLFLIMFCAGAAELAVAQWASAFAEAGLQISKTAGDLAGPCLFAILMGASRMLYGKLERFFSLSTIMTVSAVGLTVSYLVATVIPNPIVSLFGLGFCGFFVGIMWPGALSLGASTLIGGGTAMFSLLALSGDLGCTVGPALVGFISDHTGGDMKFALLCSTVYPIILVIGLAIAGIVTRKKKKQTK